MAETFDHDYPPSEWSLDGLAEALDANDRSPLPTRRDREAWDALLEDSVTGPLAEHLIDFAESAQDEPMPRTPASAKRDQAAGSAEARTENLNRRTDFQMHLMAFTLAECLEDEGRFLDDVLDYAWAWCEQTTWTSPSNVTQYIDGAARGNLARAMAGPEERFIDLRSRNGLELAEIDHLLGDALNPGLRERIRHEIETQLLEPYEAREDFWWHHPPTNNWNAVCNTACVGAALYTVEDPQRLARIVQRGVRSLEHFLAGFDADGGTAEGVGYWNFGFGYFTQLASLLEARTGGAYSLYDGPVVGEIARFPLNAQLSPGRYPAFSDSDEEAYVNPYIPSWAGQRLDDPELLALGRWALRDGADRDSDLWRNEHVGITARNLLWTRPVDDGSLPRPPDRSVFDGIEWWIARLDPGTADAPVVAAKAGHNAESHNHNDCGSVLYHYHGESLLTDLGAPNYGPDYFGEARYTYLAARSLGHSVPLVNGTEQAAPSDNADEDPDAESGAATITDRTEGDPETVEMDLAGCYPATAGLESLTRHLSFARSGSGEAGSGELRIRDRAVFNDEAPGEELESVLVSYYPMTVQDGSLIITGNRGRLSVDPGSEGPVAVEHIEDGITVVSSDRYWDTIDRDVWRARIGPADAADGEATIELSVTPESIR